MISDQLASILINYTLGLFYFFDIFFLGAMKWLS